MMPIYKFFAAPVFADENKSSTAKLLNTILLASIGFNLLNVIASLVFANSGFVGAGLNIALLVLQIALLVLLRLGHVQIVSIILVSLCWVVIFYAAYDTGGILNPVYAAQAGVIVMAGLLVSRRAIVVFAVLSILGALVLAFLAQQGLLPQHYGEVTAWQSAINYISIFSFVALLLYLTIHNVSQILKRLHREIDERRRTEVALSHSERRYRELFDANPHPMFVYDVETLRFLAVNNAIIRNYGYSREEFLAMDIKAIRPPEDVPALLDFIKNQKDRFGEGTIWRHRKKDGALIQVEIAAHVMKFEGRSAALVVAHDITERLRMEKALRESEEHLNVAIRSTDVALFNQDQDLRYTWVYNSVPGGHTEDAIIGKLEEELLPPEEAQHLIEIKQGVLESGIGIRETVQLTFGGELRDFSLAVEPTYDQDGTINGVTCVTFDITEQKRAQEEIHKSELLHFELAQQKNMVRMKEDFIRIVSHEFRTPLAIILSSKELLDQYFERLTPEQRRLHLGKIGLQVAFMVEMLEGILTLSKASAGMLEFEPKPLNLENFCRTVMDEFRFEVRDSHTFKFSSNFPDTQVMADSYLLRLIIIKLLSNAVKYSPEGSTIEIELRRDEYSAILQVRDQGVGIPLADQSKLFEPFHRGSNVREIGGTGLGLAIVKSSVEAHGGTVTYQSAENKGTAIIVSIPLETVIS